MTNIKDVMSTAEVAEYLGCSIKKAQRLGALGHIDAVKMPGRTGGYVFNGAAVKLFKQEEQAKRRHGAAA